MSIVNGPLRDGLGLDRDLVVTGFFVAVADESLAFRRFFEQERGSALRTRLFHRFVPKYEIAFGIFQTAVKHLSAFGPALDKLTAATRSWAWNADGFRFDVFALRIIAARNEFTESTFLQHHLGLSALRACFIEHDIGLFRRLGTGGKFACGFAFRITGARKELSESPPFERHRFAAVLAWLGFRVRAASVSL